MKGSWRLTMVNQNENTDYSIPQTNLRYKTYGKGQMLTIDCYYKPFLIFNASFQTCYTDKNNRIRESRNSYKYELQNDKILLTSDNDIRGNRKEIWQKTEIPADVRQVLNVISAHKTGPDKFNGVWKYEGEYMGPVREDAPELYILESYGNSFYKIYCDTMYSYFHIFASDKEKGQYVLADIQPSSFEPLSDELIIERDMFEVNIKWIDKDSYYLTYFNPRGQFYVTEKWKRAEIPEEIIQSLKDCGF